MLLSHTNQGPQTKKKKKKGATWVSQNGGKMAAENVVVRSQCGVGVFDQLDCK